MSGRFRDGGEPILGVFWDYENIRFPSGLAPHSALANLRDLALSKGSVDSLRAYMDTNLERNSVRLEDLRARMAQAGWTLADVPHDGRKDVVDKMVMVDMIIFAMKAKTPPIIILITGDQDYFYACNQLRLNRCKIILITTANAAMSLRQAATGVSTFLSCLVFRSLPEGTSGSSTPKVTSSVFPDNNRNNHTGKPSIRLLRRTHTWYIHPRDLGKCIPPAAAAATSSSTSTHQPAPLPPMDLTEGPRPLRPLSREQPLEANRESRQLQASATTTSLDRRRKGKERAVEVVTLSDDEGEHDDDSDIEVFAPPPAKTPFRPRHSRGNSAPLSSASRSHSFPRRGIYGNSFLPEPAHPPSAMDESGYGSSSPHGKIEVMYSLDEHVNTSTSSSSTSTPARTGQKRQRAADARQLSAPPVPSPVHSPGGRRRKRPRAASEPVEEEAAVDSAGAGEVDLSLDPDTSDELAFLNPATPFSSRSTASSHYDLLLTHPSPSDGEQSPLFIRQGGKKRTGTPLARKVAAKAVSGRSRLAQEVKDEDQSDSDDDSVVVLSD
ncbi:hypothetical protein JCM11251_000047 [Rhodosporidiobolus azoricus]